MDDVFEVTRPLNPRALEADGRVIGRIKKVIGLEVIVAVGIAGVDAGDVNLPLEG